jgi:VIT1/CCC1 family predicted Fe2+/Mn2+ transporter
VDELVIPAPSAGPIVGALASEAVPRRAAGLIRDVILGGQDGLVNVLGLVLGMAVATGDGALVATAGLAALLAESIAMAGVAFTATGAERALATETRATLRAESADRLAARRRDIVARFGDRAGSPAGPALDTILREVDREADAWREEVVWDRAALAPVRETRPLSAAATVGLSTASGSAVPLVPFLLLPVPQAAVVALMLGALVLATAGAVRAQLAGGRRGRAAAEMVAIGLVSAFAGFLIGQVLHAAR